MKTIYKKTNFRVLALAIALLATNACTNDFEEINTNPNGPSVIDNIGPLLTHAQQNIFAPSRFVAWRENLIYASRFSEQISFGFAGSWFGNASGFTLDQGWNDGVWDDSFGLVSAVSNNNMGDLAELDRLTAEGGDFESAADNAVVTIMKVMLLQKVADNYGGVPYTDAGTGVSKPQFQSVKEVYELMIQDLNTAISALNGATDSGLGSADQVYGGDYQKWRTLANTLKLRIAMRGRNGSGNNFSATAITEALAGPLMSSNADGLMVTRDASLPTLRQAFSSVWSFGVGGYWVLSKRLVDHLDGTVLGAADPRLARYGNPAINSGTFAGQEVALSGVYVGATSVDDFSKPADEIVALDRGDGTQFPSYVFNYADAEFLQAEAALFSLGGSNANAHFQAGIRASMEQWGVSEADIVAYLASPAGSLSGTQEEQFEQISIQRWLAVYTYGPEAWAIVRRTGYPEIEDKSDLSKFFDTSSTVENKLPQRLLYATSSYTLNAETVESILEEQGPDRMTTKLWWAK